jgi:acetylornithine deacetylase
MKGRGIPDPIELTRQLIRIPSPTGQEHAVVDFVEAALKSLDYRVHRQPVADGRDNLYAIAGPPVVVMSTHLDVVPPDLAADEDDEWIYGRGACDAKGVCAAMITAAVRLRDQGESRVGLLFVVGEETGGVGAIRANDLTPKGQFLINGEPTENRLSIGQKGAVAYRLTARGKAAHSAYPEEGHSATEALLDALAAIRSLPLPSDPLLGDTTLNIGQIAGGVAANVIPAEASATLMYRTVVDTGPLEAALRDIAGPGLEVERLFGFGHVRSPALPGWDTTTVKFASDLAHLGSWGIGYQMGPGSIRVAHTMAERIRKTDLTDGVDRYLELVRQLLAGSER